MYKLSINSQLSYKKNSFCNDSYPNVNGNDKSVYINFVTSGYIFHIEL